MEKHKQFYIKERQEKDYGTDMDLEKLNEWIELLISQDSILKFYVSKEWRKLRRETLKTDKYECQTCKAKGYYTKANTVHHVNYVRQHPELALSVIYRDSDGKMKKNLICLCHDCHEKAHEYRAKIIKVPINEEKW